MSAPRQTAVRSRFEIGLACPEDDQDIRGLLRRNAIPGVMHVTFEREPSFFESRRIHGDFCQTVVGRDRESGKLIGLGTRSVAEAFLNGQPAPLGYLADLRLEPAYRGGMLIARGYKLFRELHRDGRARLYTTVIFNGNHMALKSIARGRAGLPAYHDMGAVHCPGINLRRRRPEIDVDCKIKRGSAPLLPEIVACLNRNHARRQFAPVHKEADFTAGGRWRDCVASDFYVAIRQGQVVGVLAAWDQHAFKQTRTVGYGSGAAWLLPLANAFRKLSGGRRYPRKGELVRYLHISFVAIDGDHLDVFRALLRRAYNDATGCGYLYAIASMHERDPLLVALQEYSLTPFTARLFCVCYEDGSDQLKDLDTRIPFVEAAIL